MVLGLGGEGFLSGPAFLHHSFGLRMASEWFPDPLLEVDGFFLFTYPSYMSFTLSWVWGGDDLLPLFLKAAASQSSGGVLTFMQELGEDPWRRASPCFQWFYFSS